jgi:iron complex transport system ATP-binding protein
LSQPSRKDEAAALRILDRFAMADIAARPFSELSGGQRQMVIFARALLAEAEILILDEPTSALDLKNQSLILGWIARLAHEEGLTVFFTTHYPQHALAIADTAMLMMDERSFVTGAIDAVLTEEKMQALYGVPLKRLHFEHRGAGVEALTPFFSRSKPRSANEPA